MIDVSSPKQASELLRKHGARPSKRLGQNFLCDRNTLDRIVRAANLQPDEPVVEIGGGLGALSVALATCSPSVTVIEIDRHLEPILNEITAPHPNIHLIFQDFLRLDHAELFNSAFGGRNGSAAFFPVSATSLWHPRHMLTESVLGKPGWELACGLWQSVQSPKAPGC